MKISFVRWKSNRCLSNLSNWLKKSLTFIVIILIALLDIIVKNNFHISDLGHLMKHVVVLLWFDMNTFVESSIRTKSFYNFEQFKYIWSLHRPILKLQRMVILDIHGLSYVWVLLYEFCTHQFYSNFFTGFLLLVL